MNAATHLEVQRRASARATHRSPFAAFFLKDLRLAFPILVASLGILGILTAFYAMLPLFGREAERAFGLAYLQTTLADRIGPLAPVFWVISAAGIVLSAISISAGDSGGRTRLLLPVLPVRPSLAYASKLTAVASVAVLFLALSLLVHSLPSDKFDPPDPAYYALILVIGMAWAFAAPLFARGFTGIFVGTTLAPFALFLACAVLAHWLAPSMMRPVLEALDADRWYAGYIIPAEGPNRGTHSSTKHLTDAMTLCAAATVAATGVLLAWRARTVVLCRRTPRLRGAAQVMRVLGVAACAMLVATAATAIRAWTSDPSVSSAVATARFHRDFTALDNRALMQAWLESRSGLPPLQQTPSRPYRSLAWHAVLDRFHGPDSHWASGGIDRFRALQGATFDRFTSDPDGVRDTALALLADPDTADSGARLALARWVGGWTMMSVAVQGLAATEDESERAVLIEAVAWQWRVLALRERPVETSSGEGASAEPETEPETAPKTEAKTKPKTKPKNRATPALRALGGRFAHFDIPPFALRAFSPDRQHPAVDSRASAFVTLALLEAQLRDGTLVTQNPSSPLDRLEVDLETVVRARAAVDQPLGRIGDAFGVSAARIRADDAWRWEDLDDNETLHLRASDLFDPERTDRSYLLLRE